MLEQSSSVTTHVTEKTLQELNEQIATERLGILEVQKEVAKVIVGQHDMLEKLLIALLADGHILLEGVPGLAKTLTIKTLAKTIDVEFSRIQFTPDLLPADVTGTLIYNQKKEEFTIKKGPVFANFILADEINRSPAKVQSALLEAMQERQVTIGDQTFNLPTPFLVLATQNPIEQEGTYPLPEAQVDRFMLKVCIDYPSKEEEQMIIRAALGGQDKTQPQKILKTSDILRIKSLMKNIYMDEKIEQYIVDIVYATRFPEQYGLDYLRALISYGCSPRASINMALCAKAVAFLRGRSFVIPQDVRSIMYDVLRHRIGLSYEAEAENISSTELIDKIASKIEVP